MAVSSSPLPSPPTVGSPIPLLVDPGDAHAGSDVESRISEHKAPPGKPIELRSFGRFPSLIGAEGRDWKAVRSWVYKLIYPALCKGILHCLDGVWTMVSEDEIVALTPDLPQQICDHLKFMELLRISGSGCDPSIKTLH